MYFYSDKLERRIAEIGSTVYQYELPIHDFLVREGNDKGDAYSPIDEAWHLSKDTDQWGGFACYQWFRMEIRIPDAWAGREVALVVNTPGDIAWKVSAEYTAYLDGKLCCGLDVFHHELPITTSAKPGETHEVRLMGFSGYNERRPQISVKLVVVNQLARDFYFNLKNAFEATIYTPDASAPENLEIEDLVDQAVNLVDFRVPRSEDYYHSLAPANDLLLGKVYSRHTRSDITVSAIGHSHLDVAWLWRLMQTREKAARAFATVDRLMDKFPDFKFIQSQPQLYDFVKHDYPELYERIKKRVAEGRIVPEGGMWLESDCNLVSGESLIRQFLVGRLFFREEFGKENEILWLPDVFGYNAALPQILKGCGIKYFMTIKISWNQFNSLPMDTFWLQGLDGTKVLTHFMTTPTVGGEGHRRALPYQKTYNGYVCAETLAHGWDTYKNKESNHDLLMAFGYGDGGGGPNDDMLENSERLKDFPGIPKLTWESPAVFFERLEKQVRKHPVPTWVGELYLEFHRGTYTSMARNKRYNRKTEFLYQNSEAASVLGEMLAGVAYPREKFLENWKMILLNQFHDIIPGSSIKGVYEDSWKQYEQIIANGRAICNGALEALALQVPSREEGVLVFNPNSAFNEDEVVVSVPAGTEALKDDAGHVYPVQRREHDMVAYLQGVPQYGYRTFSFTKAASKITSLKVSAKKMENRFFRITFDKRGQISSLYDKRLKREVLAPGAVGNRLLSFEDKPMNYNAWDIDIYYTEKCWPIDTLDSIEVVSSGPVEAVVRIRRTYLSSLITQDVVLYDQIPRIDFRTTIDWKEQEILLKTEFPVDVLASRATYEIQFGAVERPTHTNTSWDVAKFEVCGHKWADLSQNDWGVSLLNDCKYGYDIHGNKMRLTLLKSGIYPNKDADKGLHQFTYSLYPHEGTWVEADTVTQALRLNNPMASVGMHSHEGKLASTCSFVSIDKGPVLIETVKKAEKEDGYIIRLYESAGTSPKTTLHFLRKAKHISVCNMVEEQAHPVATEVDALSLQFRPFEVKTFKVEF